MKNEGTKTARMQNMESRRAMAVRVQASTTARARDTPGSICVWMFSISTVASSTRTPTARALVALFALLALLLAAVGLYGVVSYTVTQSTREIGIRLALGAAARDVFLVALRQGLLPSLLGLGIGIALSLGLTPLMSRLLYQVWPVDVEVL